MILRRHRRKPSSRCQRRRLRQRPRTSGRPSRAAWAPPRSRWQPNRATGAWRGDTDPRAPASSRTARLIARFDAATGAGRERRRPAGGPRRVRFERRRSRCGTLRAVSASGHCAGTRAAAPESGRTTRRMLVDAARDARVWGVAALSEGCVVGSFDGTPWCSSGQCLQTLSGHEFQRRAGVQSNRVSIARRPPRRAGQSRSSSPNGDVVSGAWDHTPRVWDVSSGRCLRTLTGHTDDARRRRPVKTRVDRSSTPRGAQVICVAVLPNGRVVSGSRDETLKVWDVSTGRVPPDADRAHELSAAPASSRTARRSLVDGATGAGQLRRRVIERPRRLRVGRQHAQGVGRVERSVPPDADRAHGLRAAPASSRTARRSLVDAATGAGLLRRRPVERPRRVRVVRQHAQGVGRINRRLPPYADRAHGTLCGAGVQSSNALITRRRRDAQVEVTSPSCRTAASYRGRATRSRCGTCRAAPASRR